VTKIEALADIGGRKGWIGADDTASGKTTWSYYRKRPLTEYAYRLGTPELNDKAAEFLASITQEARRER